MGYIKHDTIVVTGDDLDKVRAKAIELFEEIIPSIHCPVSEIVGPMVNGTCSFFIAPDGSKEGWDTSDDAEKARELFLIWLDENRTKYWCDYVAVRFGGDDDRNEITNQNKDGE